MLENLGIVARDAHFGVSAVAVIDIGSFMSMAGRFRAAVIAVVAATAGTYSAAFAGCIGNGNIGFVGILDIGTVCLNGHILICRNI